jgi:replication factor C large subunit
MGQTKGKRNLRDNIAEKMGEKLHVSKSVAFSSFPYFEIMFENDELAWEISNFLSLDDDEIKRFRKKKIPKKVISKMEKKKSENNSKEPNQDNILFNPLKNDLKTNNKTTKSKTKVTKKESTISQTKVKNKKNSKLTKEDEDKKKKWANIII